MNVYYEHNAGQTQVVCGYGDQDSGFFVGVCVLALAESCGLIPRVYSF